ncbi:MAG: transposase [Bacteroidota bacterium]|nr:transposase [Bacteroidota bacterium]
MPKHKVPEEYRRRLPHIQPQSAVFFVTFNLRGAMPLHILDQLKDKYIESKHNLYNSPKNKIEAFDNYNDQINNIIDNGEYGPHWLKNHNVAKVVADSFHYLDRKEFKLICYCIMSNHVHFIAYKLRKPLNKIMHSLKSYTGSQCNNILKRKGAFWQREYFDRIVRDRNDLSDKIKYTINNPVKAGIVNYWAEYTFNYCSPEFIE